MVNQNNEKYLEEPIKPQSKNKQVAWSAGTCK